MRGAKLAAFVTPLVPIAGNARRQRANHVIAGVGDVDLAVRNCTATLRGKLSYGRGSASAIAAVTGSAPAGDGGDRAVRQDLADPAVVHVGDVDVSAGVHRDTDRLVQLGDGRWAAIALEARDSIAGEIAEGGRGDVSCHALRCWNPRCTVPRCESNHSPLGALNLPEVPRVPPVPPTYVVIIPEPASTRRIRLFPVSAM